MRGLGDTQPTRPKTRAGMKMEEHGQDAWVDQGHDDVSGELAVSAAFFCCCSDLVKPGLPSTRSYWPKQPGTGPV